jgi:hypothetical protein
MDGAPLAADSAAATRVEALLGVVFTAAATHVEALLGEVFTAADTGRFHP